MPDIKSIERRANGLLILNTFLCCARLTSLSQVFPLTRSSGGGGPEQDDLKLKIVALAPPIYYCCRALFYNCIAGELRHGVVTQSPEACKRWIKAIIGFYIFLIVGPTLYCAIAGVPLVHYLHEEFGKNWLPWLILASGDWFMVRVISKFVKHIQVPADLADPPALIVHLLIY